MTEKNKIYNNNVILDKCETWFIFLYVIYDNKNRIEITGQNNYQKKKNDRKKMCNFEL